MKKKTFNDLSISSTLYMVKKTTYGLYSTDDKGKVYANNLMRKFEIVKLELGKTHLYINERGGYTTTYDAKIPLAFLESTFYETKDEVFFVNIDDYDNLIRDVITQLISRAKDRIEEVRKKEEEEIIKMAQAYWDYLHDTGFVLLNPDQLKTPNKK